MAKNLYFEKDKSGGIGAVYNTFEYTITDGNYVEVSDAEWTRVSGTFSAEIFDTAQPTSTTTRTTTTATTTVTTTGE